MQFDKGQGTKYTIMKPDEGQSFWIVGDHVQFKLQSEKSGGRFVFATGMVHPGGGPPPHVHHGEDEFFYILEGTYFFVRGDKSFTGTKGDAVFLPRGTVHTFKNIGSGKARMIIGATPAGFDHFVPDAGYPCTDATAMPPEIDDAAKAKLMAACAKHKLEMKFDHPVNPNTTPLPKGTDRWVLGAHVRTILGSPDTNGQYSLAEVTCAPGRGVPPHTHDVMDEIFYVLEGEFEFDADGQQFRAGPGTFVHVPPKVLHGFRNAGSVPAKLVDYHLPGGFEKFFEECGAAADGPIEHKPEALMEIVQRHGMTMPIPSGG